MEVLEIKGDSVPALTCAVEFSAEESPAAGKDCNQRETDYIAKIHQKYNSLAKVQGEITRLKEMKKADVKKPLVEWMDRRMHILKHFEAYYKENEGKDDL